MIAAGGPRDVHGHLAFLPGMNSGLVTLWPHPEKVSLVLRVQSGTQQAGVKGRYVL